MSIEHIIQIAQQLHEQGKQPTVALIKARMSTPSPIPEVINGLQRWRQLNANPEAIVEIPHEETDVEQAEPTLAEMAKEVVALRGEVGQLREEIVMLRRLIRQATQSN